MNPLTPDQIRGNWATLLSAWNADHSLDLGRIAAEVDALIAMRVDGIYSNGTAGEFHAQAEDEFDRISQCLAEKCSAAGMPFQIGVGHMNAQISRQRLRRVVPLAPAELKAEFGDRLCFSGGVDEQNLLPRGTPGEVRAGVHRLLDVMAPGGGFFLGPTHKFQDDIPTENIVAMYEAARQWSPQGH